MATMARRARMTVGSGVTPRAVVGHRGGDAAAVVGHRRHRRRQEDPLAEQLGQVEGALLGPAGEPSFLGAVGGAGQVHEPATGAQVEEGEEQRQLARLGAEDALDGRRDDAPGPGGADRGGQPRPQGLLVAGPGVGCLPGGVEGDLAGGQIELENGLDPVGRRRRDRRWGSDRRRWPVSRRAIPPPHRW